MSEESAALRHVTESLEALSSRIAQLEFDLATFMALFGEKKTVDVLNKTASVFFGMEQSRLRDHLVLSTARLLDPAYSGRHENRPNLTFYGLIDALKKNSVNTEFVQRVEADLDTIKSKFAPVIVERNKRIAHLDRATALDGLMLAGEVSPQDYSSGLEALQDIVNAVYQKVTNTEWRSLGIPAGEANRSVREMVNRLKAAATMEPRELRERRIAYDSSTSASGL